MSFIFNWDLHCLSDFPLCLSLSLSLSLWTTRREFMQLQVMVANASRDIQLICICCRKRENQQQVTAMAFCPRLIQAQHLEFFLICNLQLFGFVREKFSCHFVAIWMQN